MARAGQGWERWRICHKGPWSGSPSCSCSPGPVLPSCPLVCGSQPSPTPVSIPTSPGARSGVEAETGLNTVRWIAIPYVAHLYRSGHICHCGPVVHDLFRVRNPFAQGVKAIDPSPEKCTSIQSAPQSLWTSARNPTSRSWMKGVFQGFGWRSRGNRGRNPCS